MPDLTVIAGGLGRADDSPRDPVSLAYLDRSDSGNALRFKRRFGERFRFVPNHGWFAFVRTHWTMVDADLLAQEAACETAALIRDEAEALKAALSAGRRARSNAEAQTEAEAEKDGGLIGSLKAWSTKSGGAPRIGGLLQLARGKMRARLENFDLDRYALNAQNWTLRFERNEAGVWGVRPYPHEAADLISRVAAVSYDPDAKCPLWDAHLERMLPDVEVRAYVQRIFGYITIGITHEQAFWIFQGRGGDGKSTTVNTVRRVLGEYATTAAVATFLGSGIKTNADAASPALASLAGDYRLVSTSEPPRGAELNEGLIKSITGGGQVRARQLRASLFDYEPRYRLIMECNHFPYVRGGDDGIWRRVRVVPWTVQLKEHERDRDLEDRIVRKESAGVLNWLIEGALSYLEAGLAEPSPAIAAREDYRVGANVFAEWLASCVVLEPGAKIAQKELYASYQAFCSDSGHEPLTLPKFGAELSNQQIIRLGKQGHNNNIMRRGARLRTPADDGEAREAGPIAGGLDPEDFPL